MNGFTIGKFNESSSGTGIYLWNTFGIGIFAHTKVRLGQWSLLLKPSTRIDTFKDLLSFENERQNVGEWLELDHCSSCVTASSREARMEYPYLSAGMVGIKPANVSRTGN